MAGLTFCFAILNPVLLQNLYAQEDKTSDSKPADNSREDALSKLEKQIQYANASERRIGMRKIKKFKASEQKRYIPIIEKIITEDPDPSIRYAAVDLLGQMESVSNFDVLLTALEDRNSLVVSAAVNALRRHKAEAAGPPIAKKIQDEDFKTNNQLLISMINFLGKQKFKNSATFLVSKLKDSETHGEIKRAILLYIGKARIIEQKDELVKILQDENAEIGTRAFAANALGHMGDKSIIEALQEELKKIEKLPDSKTRASFNRLKSQTIFALLRLGDKSVSKYILAQARDDDVRLRIQATRKISELKLEEGRAHLEYMSLNDPSDKVQKAAKKALENWGKSK